MKIAFAGTPNVAARVLERLVLKHEVVAVITRPDAPVGRKRVLSQSAVAEAAQQHDLKTLKTNHIDASLAKSLKELGAELVIVVAYGRLVPHAALDVLPWWNLHFSLLPHWRGAAPVQHSILNGAHQGVSIFQLDAGMDTGPLIGSLPHVISPDTTAGEAMLDMASRGSNLLLELLESPPQPQPQVGEGSLAPKISRDEARLDFSNLASAVARKIMAFNPEPMAWTELNGDSFRVLRAKSLGEIDWSHHEDQVLTAGEVEVTTGRVLVACGEGTRLELIEVQPAGKKPMLATDWARGLSGSVIFE